MPAGKLVSLKVAPSQSAILAFEVSGILGDVSDITGGPQTSLGQQAVYFDFETFYANLGSTVPLSPSRLAYDSAGIAADAAVTASALMALRAEPRKALLDKAVGARQNAYFQKYQNQAAIIAKQQLFYDPANPDSKYSRLGKLSTLAQNQADALHTAYTKDGRTGVVKQTTGTLNSLAYTGGISVTSGSSNGSTSTTGNSLQQNTSPTQHYSHGMDQSGAMTPTGTSETDYIATVSSCATGNSTVGGSSSGLALNGGAAVMGQGTTNTDYGYRVPAAEAAAQNQRAQISLLDEQFAAFMFAQNLANLPQVFTNELQAIDLDVKRLQVAYLDTILMSPIKGTADNPAYVTGIFKQTGEAVRAGEPVIRVESYSPVLLVGTIIYRGMIQVGTNATITTTLFSQPAGAAQTVINGSVVAAQGHLREDDWWDVVISCDNLDDNNNPVLPLRYRFDFDDTSVVIG
jgi:hypothetical protein